MKHTHLTVIAMTAALIASVTACDNQQETDSSEKSESTEKMPAIDLHEETKIGNLPAIKSQLTSNLELDSEDRSGRTVLMIAASQGHVEIVDYLISQGVNTNTASTRDKATALILAAKYGRGEVVTLLLNADADINAAGKLILTGQQLILRITQTTVSGFSVHLHF